MPERVIVVKLNVLWKLSRMESHQESPFMHYLRAVILLLALIAVPGTAVCWNLIPRGLFDDTDSISQESESEFGKEENEVDVDKENDDFDGFFQKQTLEHSGSTKAPEPHATSFFSTDSLPSERLSMIGNDSSGRLPTWDRKPVQDAGMIKTMSGFNDGASATRIPVGFSERSSRSALPQNGEIGVAEEQTSRWAIAPESSMASTSVNSLSSLEQELKSLGAKYYRLEKWGSKGNMFRFSCYVSPSSEYCYEKYFQAIDTDEIQVMRQVVEEIRHWKSRL